MVDDQVINAVQGGDFFNMVKPNVLKPAVGAVNQGFLFIAEDKIRTIRSAKFGGHNNIEYT